MQSLKKKKKNFILILERAKEEVENSPTALPSVHT